MYPGQYKSPTGMQKKGCFYGDSKIDYDAAKKFDLDFVYVSQFSEWEKGDQISKSAIKNFDKISREDALKHPNWTMGDKITIDSATMMNKALEVIEARWLFNLNPDQIEVVIHPESMVHSMVEFCDGSVMIQAALPDMRLPIAYALAYPERVSTSFGSIDWGKTQSLLSLIHI